MSSSEELELIRGSGNVYQDFGVKDPEVRQLKAQLAAQIIKSLDAKKLSVRAAHELTGFAASDFSNIRNAKLARFTLDRLVNMLGRLESGIEVSVTFKPRKNTISQESLVFA